MHDPVFIRIRDNDPRFCQCHALGMEHVMGLAGETWRHQNLQGECPKWGVGWRRFEKFSGFSSSEQQPCLIFVMDVQDFAGCPAGPPCR